MNVPGQRRPRGQLRRQRGLEPREGRSQGQRHLCARPGPLQRARARGIAQPGAWHQPTQGSPAKSLLWAGLMAPRAPAAPRPLHRVLAGGWGCVQLCVPAPGPVLGARTAGPPSTPAAASQACGSLFRLIWQDPEGPRGPQLRGLGCVPPGGRERGAQRARPPPPSPCTADHTGPDLGPAAPPRGAHALSAPARARRMNEPPPPERPRLPPGPKSARGPPGAATGPGALKRGRSGGQASGQAGSSARPPPPPGPQLPSGVATTSGHRWPAGFGGGGGRWRGAGTAATPPGAETQGQAPGAAHARSSRARARPARPRTRTPRPARAPRRDPPPRRPRALTPPPAARTRTHAQSRSPSAFPPAPRPQPGSGGAPPGPGRTPLRPPAPSPHLLGPGAAAPHSSSSRLPHGWWQRRQRRLRPWGQGDGRPGRK